MIRTLGSIAVAGSVLAVWIAASRPFSSPPSHAPAMLAENEESRDARGRFPTPIGHAGSETREDREEEGRLEFGPPPPGYVRIVADPVPNWTPDSMHAPRPRGANWEFIGPRPIRSEYWSGEDDASGRVVSIATHPTLSSTLYIATASGGIWKTTDFGATWTPMTDELSTLNHGAVAIDPQVPDTIYAGTGEYTTRSGGDGLFRSIDGGLNWQRIATAAQVGANCSKVVVDPTDSSHLFVGGSLGVARSIDGGATWSTVLAGACSDLVINRLTPMVMFAGRHGDGIYKTVDGGSTWARLSTGLPSNDVQRIVLAISRSTPATVYAAIVNSNAGLRGFYKTTNSGTNWTQLTSTPDFPSPQGWYDCAVAVDPSSANTVYCGGVFPDYAVAGVIKTTDGGTSWTDVTRGTTAGQLHPDMHAIAFGASGTVWVGCDGGVWKSSNGGASWLDTNANLAVTQNYNIALNPSNPDRIIGGTQDNGSVEKQSTGLSWPQILEGDGGFAAYDRNETFRRYTTYVYLTVFRLEGSSTVDDITGPWFSDPANFIAPLVMSPNNAHVLLGGTNRVWRTQNAHTDATWSDISGPVISDGGVINAIAVASGAENTIYAGNSEGGVYLTTNGSSWAPRSNGLPGGAVSDIAIDPADPSHAYVSYYNTSGERVLVTTNMGSIWTGATGALPAGVSAKALAVDWRFNPVHLYIGSGSGVWESADGGATWTKDGTDLPNVNIGDLQIDTTANTITAGTYGRGAWRKELPAESVCIGDFDGDGGVTLADLAILLAHFGTTGGAAFADGDNDADGDVDLQDLASTLAVFGSVCP
jgi:photosystem II stability/assembly factor-like uncharacterized protein